MSDIASVFAIFLNAILGNLTAPIKFAFCSIYSLTLRQQHGGGRQLADVQRQEPVVEEVLQQIYAFLRVVACHQVGLPKDLKGVDQAQYGGQHHRWQQIGQRDKDKGLKRGGSIHRCRFIQGPGDGLQTRQPQQHIVPVVSPKVGENQHPKGRAAAHKVHGPAPQPHQQAVDQPLAGEKRPP